MSCAQLLPAPTVASAGSSLLLHGWGLRKGLRERQGLAGGEQGLGTQAPGRSPWAGGRWPAKSCGLIRQKSGGQSEEGRPPGAGLGSDTGRLFPQATAGRRAGVGGQECIWVTPSQRESGAFFDLESAPVRVLGHWGMLGPSPPSLPGK